MDGRWRCEPGFVAGSHYQKSFCVNSGRWERHEEHGTRVQIRPVASITNWEGEGGGGGVGTTVNFSGTSIFQWGSRLSPPPSEYKPSVQGPVSISTKDCPTR